MSKFKYKFESLLQLREKLEDIKQREYAKALNDVEQKRGIKNQIKESLHINKNMLKNATRSTIDPRTVIMYKQYDNLLKDHDKIATQKLQNAVKKSEAKRDELLDAMKNKKTLSILKDKQHEHFLEEAKKSEQQIIDEIVSFAYSNNLS